MKASPLLIAWHNDKAPIYSAQFEPHGKCRLATGGGDNNVRIWQVENNGEERKITYLSTLIKHTQAVNVVRWCPRGEMLASAGDDGNVLLWVPSEHHRSSLGEEHADDKETWQVRRMCRSTSGSEIYDLAWSPDGVFFVTGSMDNVARIFDASTGNIVRQIAEHNHYVQGVAWDPLNEFLATQSSDRSVHVYKLRTNDGQFSLSQHGRMSRMDLPSRRGSSDSPVPPDPSHSRNASISENNTHAVGSPVPSAPGTPTSLPMPMNPPPPTSHSRRSSFGASSPSVRRSASPAPSLPLPAVMPSPTPRAHGSLGVKNASIYANETLTSFFRRLTFAPDGSLLFTPAGQYKTSQPTPNDPSKTTDEITNTVYIYSRGGLNKPPIAHLPGHKKPSVAVKCSPVYYNLRLPTQTQQITIDTSSTADDIPPLPEPILPTRRTASTSSMDPPPFTSAPSPAPSAQESESNVSTAGPQPAFALPYRIVYAVATQDAVFVYDTQQQTPICVVSNLHFATFTDLTWSHDGSTLLMSSSDGFCSSLSFAHGELGTPYHGSLQSRAHHPTVINTSTSTQSTPIPTPTGTGSASASATATTAPPLVVKHPSSAGFAPSPSPVATTVPSRTPASPTRSNSNSSIATQSSFAQTPSGGIINNPTPSLGGLPSIAAAHSAVPGTIPITSPTPPMTPRDSAAAAGSTAISAPPPPTPPAATASTAAVATGTKREGEPEDGESRKETKKRRIAPTRVVSGNTSSDSK